MNVEQLLVEHGPIIDVERWTYGCCLTFSDGFIWWLQEVD